jgi:hypothetical protein
MANGSQNTGNKTEGQQLLEAAVYGLALGIAIYAIASYLNKKD